MSPKKQKRRRLLPVLLPLYLAALAGSHIYLAYREPAPRPTPEEAIAGLETLDLGHGNGRTRLAYLQWDPPGPATPAEDVDERLPVILLHGSPGGGARDCARLAAALAAKGRTAIAVDRLGYGRSEHWVADYSAEANMEAVAGLMDSLGMERAHVLGWSYSGAVVAHLAASFPGRTKSVIMLSAIGIQEGEGSGSYGFEHAKYALGALLVVALPEAIPHFGLLGSRSGRHAFIRDFWDLDQRPLRGILGSLTQPVLIVHGAHDSLVPAWVAEVHHQIVPQNRLVILDADHFFPFLPSKVKDLDLAVTEIERFLRETESTPGGQSVTLEAPKVIDYSDNADLRLRAFGGLLQRSYKPWWLVAALSLILCAWGRRIWLILCALAAAGLYVDAGVALLGVVSGYFAGSRLRGEGGWAFLWRIPLWFIAAMVAGSVLLAWLQGKGLPVSAALGVSGILLAAASETWRLLPAGFRRFHKNPLQRATADS